jgi:hypothetical protein
VVVPLLEVVVPLLEVVVPLLLPPLSGPPSGGGRQGPQTPSALPGAVMQVSPGQQSPFMLHLPQLGTQVPPPW